MVGAIAQDGSSNRYDVALHISEKTGGKHFLLPAPLLADSEAERAQWCNHRLYRIVESLTGEADVAFVGIGNVGPHCPLYEDGFITAAEVKELVQHKAVAEMLGLPIDASGAHVESSTGQRVTSVSLDSAYRYAASPSDSTAIVRAEMPSSDVPTCRCSGRIPTVTLSPCFTAAGSTATRWLSPVS